MRARVRAALAAAGLVVGVLAAPSAAGIPAAPHVSEVSPTQGLPTGGTKVVVTGDHLHLVRAVTFGGVAGSRLRHRGPHRLTVLPPVHDVGRVAIRLLTRRGHQRIGWFTYAMPPAPGPPPPTVPPNPLPVVVGPVVAVAPVPAGYGPEARVAALDDVTCPAPGECFAVGAFDRAPDDRHPLVEQLSGGTWTAVEVPVPADARSDDPVVLRTVSCPSPTYCVALGWYDAVSDPADAAFTATWTGGTTWSVTPLPYPTNTADDNADEYVDLECGAVGSCAAVGSYDTRSGRVRGVAATLSGGVWTVAGAPAPGKGGQNGLLDVDCPAAGSCVAVGDFSPRGADDVPFALRLDTGTWSPTLLPLPPNADQDPRSGGLMAVDCATSVDCTAVGSFASTTGNRQTQPLVSATSAGGAWSSVAVPVLDPQAYYSRLYRVSCSSPVSCVGTGGLYSGGADDQFQAVSIHGPVTVPFEIASAVGSGTVLADVDCGSTGSCTAVGFTRDLPSQPFIATIHDGSVTPQQLAIPPATFGGLSLVTGDSPTTTVAVGSLSDGTTSVTLLVTGIAR